MSNRVGWNRNFYTPDEESFVRDNYLSMSCKDIARHLGRSEHSVRRKAQKLSLKKADRGTCHEWTEEEDAIIRAVQDKYRPLQEVADELGVSAAKVAYRAKSMGITAWKSRRPGYKNTNGYVVIEHSANATRIYEHRLVMEAHIGRPLAANEIVHHINGIKNDNRIENLHLFSSSSEHRRSHSSLLRLAPELLDRGIIYFDGDTGMYELRDDA